MQNAILNLELIVLYGISHIVFKDSHVRRHFELIVLYGSHIGLGLTCKTPF